jgi:arylsulfatase A-like enzyme
VSHWLAPKRPGDPFLLLFRGSLPLYPMRGQLDPPMAQAARHTPTLSRIAQQGISYNRFHTTAMCSPTRAALLIGRNHQRVGAGQIAELANDWDGYSGTQPKTSAMVAEVLKDHGYRTAAFGKWHNTPAEQTTAGGGRSTLSRSRLRFRARVFRRDRRSLQSFRRIVADTQRHMECRTE